MLLFVIGLPGRFTDRLSELVAALVGAAVGPTDVVPAGTLEEIALRAMRASAPNLIVQSHAPGDRLRSALAEAGQKFVVALGNPLDELGDLVRNRQLSVAEATRQVAGSCAAVRKYATDPGALVVSPENGMAGLPGAIAAHLQLAVKDRERQRLGRLLSGSLQTTGEGGPAEWWDGLDAAERAVAEGAIGGYLDRNDGPDIGPIVWMSELFYRGDRSEEPLDGDIDITGRARCLVRGPGIMLPAGAWSLSLEMTFSPEAREYEFTLEVLAGTVLASRTIVPGTESDPAVDIQFVVEDAANTAVEIRFSSQRSAFDGRVTLVRAVLVPRPKLP